MGHDIFGWTKEPTEENEATNKEIAYLRFSAWNNQAREIYKALGVEECDCGCSGCGYSREFGVEHISVALGYAKERTEMNREREFLDALLEHTMTGKTCWVTFA